MSENHLQLSISACTLDPPIQVGQRRVDEDPELLAPDTARRQKAVRPSEEILHAVSRGGR